MLKDIWRVLTGVLSWEYCDELYHRWRLVDQQTEQLKRDLNLAQAAIVELKSQLPQPYVEEARRQASDNLAAQVLQDMQDNPKKFIP